MVGVARLSLGTMWLTCSKSNWVGVCVIGSGHCLSFLRYDSFASRCNMTQLHPTGIAQEKGKIGLSNKPIFPQIPCLSQQRKHREEPEAHTSGACLLLQQGKVQSKNNPRRSQRGGDHRRRANHESSRDRSLRRTKVQT